MRDVVGKRNWFFLFSGLITVPGLIFILLTFIPGAKLGLQFAIDYTGGTVWSIRFQDPNVTPDQVHAVFARRGLEAAVTRTGGGFLEIRRVPLGLEAQPSQSPSPSPSGSPSPSASGSAGTSPSTSANASASASPSSSLAASPSPSTSAAASPSPSTIAAAGASGSPGPSGSPGASPTPSASAPSGNTTLPTEGELGQVRFALEEALGPIAEQHQLTTVGPVVSSDLIADAIKLIIIGSIGILLWITYRFRDVKFGATALAALLHDVIVVVGIFAILGTFFGLEVDGLFVTAMLTVIGFSVHDTIVVFDRIRENKARHAGEPFDRIVNHSILQTLARSITTSFTVVLTLLALLLFGGSATTYFVLALLIGIISGTYSSIFNASPLLVVWQEWEDRRRGRLQTARVPRRATP